MHLAFTVLETFVRLMQTSSRQPFETPEDRLKAMRLLEKRLEALIIQSPDC